jgi:hypothetical protein
MCMNINACNGGANVIKTTMTVSFRAQDIQKASYLINGTHLGLLSTVNQSIYIQTNHRPVQYIVGIKSSEPEKADSLAKHRRELSRWQEFIPVLLHQGPDNLNALLKQYQLLPDLLICLTDYRLQAWIPAETGFCIVRDDTLRRMKPIEFKEPPFDEQYHENHHYYNVHIQEMDYFLFLDPEITRFFPPGEIASILMGLSQLPSKMGEIMQTAQQRGFEKETGWMAIEILRKEADHHPKPDHQRSFWSTMSKKDEKEDPDRTDRDDLDSESLAEDEETRVTESLPWFTRLKTDKIFRTRLIAIATALVVFLVILIVLVMSALGRNVSGEATQTTQPSITEPTATTTRKPTQSPTATPVPTEPKVILVVAARALNLRDAPNLDGRLLMTLENGDRLIQLEEPKDDWVKVENEDGLIGYVYARYTEEASEIE